MRHLARGSESGREPLNVDISDATSGEFLRHPFWSLLAAAVPDATCGILTRSRSGATANFARGELCVARVRTLTFAGTWGVS